MATSHRDGMAIRSVSAATTNDSHYSAVQFTADYDPMTSYPSHLLLPASLPPEKKVDTSEDCGIGSRQTELGTSRYVGGPSTDSLIPSSTASDVTNYALNDVTLLRHSSQFSLFRATKRPPRRSAASLAGQLRRLLRNIRSRGLYRSRTHFLENEPLQKLLPY